MELLLFALDDEVTAGAAEAGIDAVVVDLEKRAKGRRQAGFDTGISGHEPSDIDRVRRLTPVRVVVRVDGPAQGRDRLRRQLHEAVSRGADELLVPMVADADEIEQVLDVAPPDVPLGVLIERPSAVADVERIGTLPLSRVYLGLMDLMVSTNARTPFDPLVDGRLDTVVAATEASVGAAGLTRPGRGTPLPVELLAAALVSAGCDHTFLRRSFHQDLRSPEELVEVVAEIRAMLARLSARTAGELAADVDALAAAIDELVGRSLA